MPDTNDIPRKTIPTNVFGWFSILYTVILIVYNDIGRNDNPEIVMSNI